MVILHCEPTFKGFLSAFFDATSAPASPQTIIIGEPECRDMLNKYIFCRFDTAKSAKVAGYIKSKMGDETYLHSQRIFLYGENSGGDALYRYLRRGLELGRMLNHHLTDSDVNQALSISGKVAREANRMTGFVRFRKTGEGIYLSQIEPDSNILPLITPHFAARFANEKFIIHDLKRRKAALYNGQTLKYINDTPSQLDDVFLSADKRYETLFRQYFKTIDVVERRKLRQQAGFMPHRYRKHMPETWTDK